MNNKIKIVIENFISFIDSMFIVTEGTREFPLNLSNLDSELGNFEFSKNDIEKHVWRRHVEIVEKDPEFRTCEQSWFTKYISSKEELTKYLNMCLWELADEFMTQLEDHEKEIRLYYNDGTIIGEYENKNNPGKILPCKNTFIVLKAKYINSGDDEIAKVRLYTAYPMVEPKIRYK